VCLSCAPTFTYPTPVIYLLIEHIVFKSSLLSLFLVVLILVTVVIRAL
jgi:hypothetical protein